MFTTAGEAGVGGTAIVLVAKGIVLAAGAIVAVD
jgi:hypothetical protein